MSIAKSSLSKWMTKYARAGTNLKNRNVVVNGENKKEWRTPISISKWRSQATLKWRDRLLSTTHKLKSIIDFFFELLVSCFLLDSALRSTQSTDQSQHINIRCLIDSFKLISIYHSFRQIWVLVSHFVDGLFWLYSIPLCCDVDLSKTFHSLFLFVCHSYVLFLCGILCDL